MNILCATDLLPRSDAAVERSGQLATELQSDLSLLHVVAPIASEHVLEQELHLAIAQMKSRSQPPAWSHEIAPSVMVRAGNPTRIILETARQSRAGLLVAGPHRYRGVRDALEGSIAEKVLATREIPMLIVRRKPRGHYRNVVLALDLSDASRHAVRVAESLGFVRDGGHATVVHAYDPPYRGMVLQYSGSSEVALDAYSTGWKREHRAAISDLLKAESQESSRYDLVLEEGKPAPGIMRCVHLLEPDLLVLGTRGGGRIHRALLGSVANEVLFQARCDVLVIPHAAQEERKASPQTRDRSSARQVRNDAQRGA